MPFWCAWDISKAQPTSGLGYGKINFNCCYTFIALVRSVAGYQGPSVPSSNGESWLFQSSSSWEFRALLWEHKDRLSINMDSTVVLAFLRHIRAAARSCQPFCGTLEAAAGQYGGLRWYHGAINNGGFLVKNTPKLGETGSVFSNRSTGVWERRHAAKGPFGAQAVLSSNFRRYSTKRTKDGEELDSTVGSEMHQSGKASHTAHIKSMSDASDESLLEQIEEVGDFFEQRSSKIASLVEDLSLDESQKHNHGTGFDRAKAKKFVKVFFDRSEILDNEEQGSGGDVDLSQGYDSGESGDEEEMLSVRGEFQQDRESAILEELKGLRRGSRRIVLQKLLQGGILQADPVAAQELKKIEQSSRPPSGFRMKVVNVNRTSKGTRAGGLFRFSALVVVGNGQGVLGWGYGKAVEVGNAVQKAHQAAYKNLYPIPRHNGHTIPEPVTATFGKTKVIMYPKSSGRGIVANPVLASICKLCGIYDIGIKVHGSRNPLNTIKCLFAAFDKLKTQDEIIGRKPDGTIRIPVPTGRFGKVRIPGTT